MSNRETIKRLLLSASLGALLLPNQALSQETINADEIPEDEIITVGRKVESLQNYAGTAAKFDGEDLKALGIDNINEIDGKIPGCLLYTSPSPRDRTRSRMPSSA